MRTATSISFLYRRVVFLLVVFALAGAEPSNAGVKVSSSTDTGVWLDVYESITNEDVGVVEQAVARASNRSIWFDLNSSGGDWAAAMAIGRIIRKHHSVAQVMGGKQCSSACVLILAAAQVRLVSESARIGIHRPYSSSTKPTSLEEGQRRYRQLEETTRTFLRDMNIPISLFDAMVRVPPERLRILSMKEMQEFGLEGKDPAYEEVQDQARASELGLERKEYLIRKARVDLELIRK